MPRIPTTEPMQAIFDEFSTKIVDKNYYPETPIDTLKSRITAVFYLEGDNEDLGKNAADFIRRTSTTKEEDIQRLKSFASTIKKWHALDILSIYTTNLGPYVEYKLHVTTAKGQEAIHRHALYKDLGRQQYCYVSQHPPLVRVIGDPVLHQPGIPFPIIPTEEQKIELWKQIDSAKTILAETGGAGIASNQCASIESPYQFAIVGVLIASQTHVRNVARRYPGVTFPAAMIMVNPRIIACSEDMQCFKHGCLSVPSPNRCEVQSPLEITVEYLDPVDMTNIRRTLKGMDAVVLWHELNHIIEGKTYMDTALASLAPADLTKFEKIIAQELSRRAVVNLIPDLTVPPFYFTIVMNTQGKPRLNIAKLTEALPKFTTETLQGLLQRCPIIRAEAQMISEKKSSQEMIKMGIFSPNKYPPTGVVSTPFIHLRSHL